MPVQLSETTRDVIHESESSADDSEGFKSDQIFTISLGHFVHDSFSAFIAPLLPILQEKLATGYALTGMLAVLAQLPGLLNPFLGYLADRVSLRYFVILAPAVTATLMSCMGLMPDYLTLALLLIASGVSIAAFHAPAPAMIGRLSGNRIGKGMSIFMASGELGRTAGPLLAVTAVGWFGLEGMWRLAVIGWAVSCILYLRLRNVSARSDTQRATSLADFFPRARRVFLPLIWLTQTRVFVVVSITTYLPIFMSDVRESNLFIAAGALTILEGAGVVGAVATGTLSDRFGRTRILTLLLGISPLLLFAFIYGPEWTVLPLLIGLGLTAISPTPVIMAVVQDQFPDRRALANGTFLAISFLLRAVAIWCVGLVSDRVGLHNAYLFSGLIALLALPAVRLIPSKPPSIGRQEVLLE